MTDKYIHGTGSLGAKIVVLKEGPNDKDVARGQLGLDKETIGLLHDAGISVQDIWLTSVSKYYVPPNPKGGRIPYQVRAKRAGVDLDQQLFELQAELNQIKPNVVIGLGKTALWGMVGKDDITSYRGSILHGRGFKFIPTYNPEHLSWQATDIEFKGYFNREIIKFDFKRAAKQAHYPEYVIPKRVLHIAKSSHDLYEFYKRYKHLESVSVDIEAGGHYLPICIGLSFDKRHGICVPLWNQDGISTIPTSDLAQIWRLLAEILYNHYTIGQNFNYDRDKIRRLGFIIRFLKSDVMLKGFAINPELPKNLAFNTSIYTEEPFYKNEGMYEGSYNDLFIGCARDACVTKEIDEAMDSDLDELGLRKFYENFLMELPGLYLEIENTGFNINQERATELLKKYVKWDEQLRYELFALVGTQVNVNSPKQIYDLLFNTLKCPRRDGTSEEELTSLLNLQSFTDEPKRRVVELILEDRRVRKSISTYLMALPDYDGRMKTTCFPCLETGRSSTGQQDPPIRPSLEVIDEYGKKKKKVMGIAFQTMTKHGDIGADIRSMYEPDPGWILVQADSAQAEARVVFKLADDEQALRDIDEHDYHALTASWFFGGTEDSYSKRVLGYEHPIRFVGKTLRHAGHLGAGKKRAAISVNTDARKFKIDIKIDEKIADKALNIFHAKQPKIRHVFHHGIVEALKHDRRLTAGLPYGIDAPCGGKRLFMERWGEELFRQAFSYIPQRSVSDNTKAAGLRTKARYPTAKLIMESHDALLFMIPLSEVNDFVYIIREEMERPLDFSACSLRRTSLVIPCEVELGENYKDFKKFKFPVIESAEPKQPIRELTLAERMIV